MRQKPETRKSHGEKVVEDIRRATRKQYSTEEKIKIALDGLKGEDSIAELCRREGIAQCLYYSWSKEFLEVGKNRARIWASRIDEPGRPPPKSSYAIAHLRLSLNLPRNGPGQGLNKRSLVLQYQVTRG